jgi:hypothetical protein
LNRVNQFAEAEQCASTVRTRKFKNAKNKQRGPAGFQPFSGSPSFVAVVQSTDER